MLGTETKAIKKNETFKSYLMKTCRIWAGPGDVVKVRAGYARNYLLPRKLAVEAGSEETCAHLSIRRESRRIVGRPSAATRSRSREKDREALAHASMARAGEEGKLFGSITNIDIETRESAKKGLDNRAAQGFTCPSQSSSSVNSRCRSSSISEVEASLKITVAAPSPTKGLAAKMIQNSTTSCPAPTAKKVRIVPGPKKALTYGPGCGSI